MHPSEVGTLYSVIYPTYILTLYIVESPGAAQTDVLLAAMAWVGVKALVVTCYLLT